MSTENREPVRLTVSSLQADVDAGYTKEQMSANYGIDVKFIGMALRKAGIKIKKRKSLPFILVDDTNTEVKAV